MDDVRPIDGAQSAEVTIMTEGAPLPAKRNMEAGASVSAIVPRDLDQAWRLAGNFVRAGMVPDSFKGRDEEETRAKVMLGIMKGLEVGLPPVTALSTICIVNNRPSLWGDGAVALIQGSGKLEWMRERLDGAPGTDGWTAVCEMKRHGQSEIYVGTFSFGDAKRAKLTGKGPWMAYPQRMLRWRAFAWAARNGFSDVLCGLSVAEEAQDIPPAPPPVTDTTFLDAGMQPPAAALPPPGAEAQQDAHGATAPVRQGPGSLTGGSSRASGPDIMPAEGEAAAPVPRAPATGATIAPGAAADPAAVLAWCPSMPTSKSDATYKAGEIVKRLTPLSPADRMAWFRVEKHAALHQALVAQLGPEHIKVKDIAKLWQGE